MSVTVITPPDAIVTVAKAKHHLRVEHGDDDSYIADLIETATAWIDGPNGWLGQALGEQTLEAVLSAEAWRCRRSLPYPPLQEIVSETPSTDGRTVAVRFKAGYGFVGEGEARRSLVPAPIRHAILLMVGDLYGNRESGGVGSVSFDYKMPTTVENLLAPFRVWRV